MADEQIKIRILADSKQFEVASDAVAKKLKSIGIEADITQGKVQSLDNTMKKTNQQWTNLALVIQDLPYGFRGIQNNLPALVGGFAAATGPIYLGISTVIAALTILDQKTSAAASAAKKLKDEQKSLGDQLLESSQNARTQGLLLQGYVTIANNVNLAENTRQEALKKANEIYGVHNEKLTLTNINTKKIKESLDGYIQSLINFAVAEKYAAQIADKIIEKDKIQAQIDEKKKKSYALLLEYTGKQTLASRDVVDVMADRRKVEAEIYNLNESKKSVIKEITDLTNNYTVSLTEATKASALFGALDKDEIKQRDKAVKDAEKYAKDQVKLKAWVAKQTARFGQLEAAPKELSGKEQQDAYYKQLQGDFAAKMAFDKKTSESTITNLRTQYQQELALTGTDYKAKIDLQTAYLEQLKQGYMDGTIGLTEFNKERNALIIQQNKTVTDAAKANMADVVRIGTSIMSALGPALDMLLEKGASLGEVLGQAFKDILKKLLKVMIAAAITVAILATIGLVKWDELGKAYGKFVTAGMGFGNLDFAGAKTTAGVANGTAENVSNSINPSQGMNVNVSGRISGNDILLASQKASSNNNVTF